MKFRDKEKTAKRNLVGSIVLMLLGVALIVLMFTGLLPESKRIYAYENGHIKEGTVIGFYYLSGGGVKGYAVEFEDDYGIVRAIELSPGAFGDPNATLEERSQYFGRKVDVLVHGKYGFIPSQPPGYSGTIIAMIAGAIILAVGVIIFVFTHKGMKKRKVQWDEIVQRNNDNLNE